MLESYDTMIVFNLFGWPVNMTIFSSWIVIGLIAILVFIGTRNLKTTIHVSRFQTVLEMLVGWLRGEVRDISQDNPAKYIGIILSLFLFILVANFLTIIPWFRPPTASLSTTLAFAAVVFFAIPYFAIKNVGVVGYFKKFIQPTPFMLFINVFSEFASSFAMALRLYGNMVSGVMFGVILTSFVPFLFPIPLQILGLLTGSIQAYIFALLATVYTSNVRPQTPYVDDMYHI